MRLNADVRDKPHKQVFLTVTQKRDCENLRGIKTVGSGEDLSKYKLVQDSVAIYSCENFAFPTFVYTLAQHVGWDPGFTRKYRDLLLPIHHNWQHGKRGKKLGDPIVRHTKDFENDMKNCMYVVGNTRKGKTTAWNTRSEKSREVCVHTKTVLQFLSKFATSIIPAFWNDELTAASNNVKPSADFTAGVVSFNYESVFHLDELDKNVSVLTVFKPNEVTGGYLLFPEYCLAFPLHDGDVLIFNGKTHVHGTAKLTLPNNQRHVFRLGIIGYE